MRIDSILAYARYFEGLNDGIRLLTTLSEQKVNAGVRAAGELIQEVITGSNALLTQMGVAASHMQDGATWTKRFASDALRPLDRAGKMKLMLDVTRAFPGVGAELFALKNRQVPSLLVSREQQVVAHTARRPALMSALSETEDELLLFDNPDQTTGDIDFDKISSIVSNALKERQATVAALSGSHASLVRLYTLGQEALGSISTAPPNLRQRQPSDIILKDIGEKLDAPSQTHHFLVLDTMMEGILLCVDKSQSSLNTVPAADMQSLLSMADFVWRARLSRSMDMANVDLTFLTGPSNGTVDSLKQTLRKIQALHARPDFCIPDGRGIDSKILETPGDWSQLRDIIEQLATDHTTRLVSETQAAQNSVKVYLN